MSCKLSLYHKALLAWRQELKDQHKAIIEDKQMRLRNRVPQKLINMFGPDHSIELEDKNDPDDIVLGVEVEELRFLALRSPAGNINIILLELCPQCNLQMTSTPLLSLADLGRELLQFEMNGILSNHECV